MPIYPRDYRAPKITPPPPAPLPPPCKAPRKQERSQGRSHLWRGGEVEYRVTLEDISLRRITNMDKKDLKRNMVAKRSKYRKRDRGEEGG